MTLGDLYPDVRLYSEVENDQGERGEWEGHMGEGGKVGGGSGRDIWEG